MRAKLTIITDTRMSFHMMGYLQRSFTKCNSEIINSTQGKRIFWLLNQDLFNKIVN